MREQLNGKLAWLDEDIGLCDEEGLDARILKDEASSLREFLRNFW